MITGTAYAVLQPKHDYWGQVNGIKVVKVMQKKPDTVNGVLVKLTFQAAGELFDPLEPEAEIIIPNRNSPIRVEAT